MTQALSGRTEYSYLREVPEDECFGLLAVALVGRIGFVAAEGVQIIPVNYRLGAGRRLFVKTSPTGPVAHLADRDAEAVFEVDYYADDFQIAWSVLLRGVLSRLDEAASAAYEELRRPPVPWPGPADAVPVMFRPRTVSGRALLRTRPD